MLGIGTLFGAVIGLFKKLLFPIIKLVAIIVIAAFLVSWIGMAFGGFFLTPLIPAVSPEPLVSGYLGVFSGIVSLGIIPFMILIWMLFRILFGYRVSRRARRFTFGIWLVTILCCGLTVLFGARNFVHEYSDSEIVMEREIVAGDSLTFSIANIYDDVINRDKFQVRFDGLVINKGEIYMKNVNVNMVPSSSSIYLIEKTSRASGAYRSSAERCMNAPIHEVQWSESGAVFPSYTRLPKGKKYRMQCYDYTVKIPVGTVVSFDGKKNLFRHRDVNNEMVDFSKIYVMKEAGLSVVES